MYTIQVDNCYWLVDFWRGWLVVSTNSRHGSIHRTLSEAQEAIDFYCQVAPNRTYQVRSVI